MVNINKRIICILIVLIYSISLIFNVYKYDYKYNSDIKDMKYNVMIIEKQKEYENKISYLARVNNDKFILNIYTKNKYDTSKNYSKEKIKQVKEYKYGDYIEVLGKITIPEILGNIGEFNYKKYLNSKDICGIVNAYKVEYVDNIGNKCIKLIYKLKDSISKNIDSNLEDKEAELLKSMLYGNTSNLDKDIKETFNEIGISHITAVSGSNLNILLFIISFLLYRIKNRNKIYILIQILFIFIFCIISGMELSIIRASIMCIIGIIFKYKNIKISIEKNLLITLYIMTLLNPFRIFNIGMLFSFLAIVGLVYFSLKIYNFLESKIKWNIQNKVVVKLLCYISKILSVTLSVNILILPLSIYSFNKFSPIFIISNLFVSTLSTVINVLGIISICLTKIPYISNISYFILELLLKSVISISKFLNEINVSINVKSFSIIILLIYYSYILIVCIKIKSRRKYTKIVLDKVKRKLVYLLVSLIVLVFVHNHFFNNYIYFFNVGQGEMAIIKNRDTVIMVDSGSISNDAAYIFESYMKKENIQKIDALVISHFHSDHINGIQEILKLCNVKYIIYAYPYDLNSQEYVNFINQIKDKNIKQIIVKAGDNIKVNKISLNVLNPSDKYIIAGNKLDKNENANSLVLNLNINNKNFLFMGDSLKESEEYILQELEKQGISNIELIKIGHHGSKTSTSESFIQYILPKYAIISSKKKIYNHPSRETIDILNRYNVITYITEIEGGLKYII